jgi:hypothetical protein
VLPLELLVVVPLDEELDAPELDMPEVELLDPLAVDPPVPVVLPPVLVPGLPDPQWRVPARQAARAAA